MSIIQYDFEDILPQHEPNEGRVIINRNFDRISGFTISFGSVFVQSSGNTAAKDIRPRVGGGQTAVAVLGDHAFAAGGYNNIPAGDRSFSSGFQTSATSAYATSMGNTNLASGINSFATNSNNIAEGLGSFAQGFSTVASGDFSHTQGSETRASGQHSHAEGYYTTGSSFSSHAEGSATLASGYHSHAEGSSTRAIGDNSHAQGNLTIAEGYNSHSQGYKTTASTNAISSFVSGEYNITNSPSSAILGGSNNTLTSSANRSIILGGQNIVGTEPDTVYGINFNISGNLSASTIFSGDTNLGDLIVNVSSGSTAFNGNRTVKRSGVPNLNVGGETVQEWLNNYFFPFVPATLSTSSNQTIEVGVTITPVIQYNITLKDETIVTEGRFIDVTNGNTTINTLPQSSASADTSYNAANITPSSQSSFQWKVEADVDNDGNPDTIESGNYTITAIYPWFYGTVASGGVPAGDNRPVANQALINSGTKVTAGSNGTINASFGSTADDYLWFAIPESSNSKTVWYETSLNNGSIGGVVDPGGNLFPDFDLVNIDSPSGIWNGVNYKIYISNFQSGVPSLQLRNS